MFLIQSTDHTALQPLVSWFVFSAGLHENSTKHLTFPEGTAYVQPGTGYSEGNSLGAGCPPPSTQSGNSNQALPPTDYTTYKVTWPTVNQRSSSSA